MAVLLVSMLTISMPAHSSANWCVCKKGEQDKVLQQALDYACGNRVDYTPIMTVANASIRTQLIFWNILIFPCRS
ncbi:hypothetical protein L1887_09316 [Cichorium endivia]|nr:hypothetical protein L1887_09316 [Cichorium endivia]